MLCVVEVMLFAQRPFRGGKPVESLSLGCRLSVGRCNPFIDERFCCRCVHWQRAATDSSEQVMHRQPFGSEFQSSCNSFGCDLSGEFVHELLGERVAIDDRGELSTGVEDGCVVAVSKLPPDFSVTGAGQ